MQSEAGPSTFMTQAGQPQPTAPAMDQPPQRPHRAVIACETCRLRKIKCSADKPICRTCRAGNKTCVYPPPPARRRNLGGFEADGGMRSGNTPAASSSSSGGIGQQQPSAQQMEWANIDFSSQAMAWLFGRNQDQTQAINNDNTLGVSDTTANNHSLNFDDIFAFDPTIMPMMEEASNHQPTFSQSLEQMPPPVEQKSTPTAQSKLRIPYFRFFGATAIAPGYKQMIGDVETSPLATSDPETPGREVLDTDGERPTTRALQHLLPIFLRHFGYFYPRLRLDHNSSVYLLNIACALASRFSPIYCDRKAATSLWASKAKEQAARRLGVSSTELVQTLLLISWNEFAESQDGVSPPSVPSPGLSHADQKGLWMWSGMAIRMGNDLGVDNPLYNQSDESQYIYGLLKMQDAIMSIGTGRPSVLSTADQSLPQSRLFDGSGMSDPFPFVVHILFMACRISSILAQPGTDRTAALETTQKHLSEFFMHMPPDLRFETSTFQSYAALDLGGSFLLLHLWYHAMVILAYWPAVLENGDTTAGRFDIALSSAKTVLNVVDFAELIDMKAVTQPWINYPLYIAARLFLVQSLPAKTESNELPTGTQHMARMARAHFQQILRTFSIIEKHWSGVHFIRAVLQQREEGVRDLILVDPTEQDPWTALLLQMDVDGVGLSLSGTVYSPTDNQVRLVYPVDQSGGSSSSIN